MPSFLYESKFPGQNVVGIDEVGRGPLAGPVVAAAVMILDCDQFLNQFSDINDSKKLTKKKRESLNEALTASSFIAYGIGQASVKEIDSINILQATFLAMKRALENLPCKVHVALIDGNKEIPGLENIVQYPIIQGDSKSYSIAAASVIAKVFRDRLMEQLSQKFPMYGWSKNAGYGTKEHIQALNIYGITEHHRKTFAPISKKIDF